MYIIITFTALELQVIGFNFPPPSQPHPQVSLSPGVSDLPATGSVLGFPTTNNNSDNFSMHQDLSSLSEDEHKDRLLSFVEARDLMSYGMIPEFVGRFPVIVNLHHLDVESLVSVLTRPKNALVPQFVSLFKMDQVCLWHNYTIHILMQHHRSK